MSEHRDKAVEAAHDSLLHYVDDPSELSCGCDYDFDSSGIDPHGAAREALTAAELHLQRMYFEQFREVMLSNVEDFGTGYWGAVADKRKLHLRQRHDEAKDIHLFRVGLEAALDKAQELMEEGH